jgi:hypothetical protein
MGGYPSAALQIRPPEDPTAMLQRAMGIKSLMLGQQIQQNTVAAQGRQAETQGMDLDAQRRIIAAQKDPAWNAADSDGVVQLLSHYGVPVEYQQRVLQGISETRKLVQGQSDQAVESTQKFHNFLDDQYQGVATAPPDQRQSAWEEAIGNARKYVGQLPAGPVRDAINKQIDSIPAVYDPNYIAREHGLLRSAMQIHEDEKTKAQTAEAAGKGAEAQAAAAKTTAETANLPTPWQASAQQAATLAKTQAETAASQATAGKTQEELHQLRQQSALIGTPDPTGFRSPLPVTEYNKRYDAFSKSPGFTNIQKLQGSYAQFQDVLNDLDSGKPLTGAASVTALFNAIGISAEPLAGKGFRINSNTIQEHVGARGLDQAAYQKVLSLKNGDVITPQQVKDYASIAANVYKNAFVIASDEAHRQGLPADFLPQGGGKALDSTTAQIFAESVAHANPRLAANRDTLKAAVIQAAQKNGWTVQ